MKWMIFYSVFFVLFACQILYAETMISVALKKLDNDFKNSLYKVARMLPFSAGSNVMSSNISYSFNSINGKIHYEASIEYSFRYSVDLDVMSTLVYSEEEAEYYFSFIQGASIFLDANSDIKLINFTNNQNIEQYLWQKSEKIVYYVPGGSQEKTYLMFKMQLVPRQKEFLLQHRQVIESILKRTKWNQVLETFNH